MIKMPEFNDAIRVDISLTHENVSAEKLLCCRSVSHRLYRDFKGFDPSIEIQGTPDKSLFGALRKLESIREAIPGLSFNKLNEAAEKLRSIRSQMRESGNLSGDWDHAVAGNMASLITALNDAAQKAHEKQCRLVITSSLPFLPSKSALPLALVNKNVGNAVSADRDFVRRCNATALSYKLVTQHSELEWFVSPDETRQALEQLERFRGLPEIIPALESFTTLARHQMLHYPEGVSKLLDQVSAQEKKVQRQLLNNLVCMSENMNQWREVFKIGAEALGEGGAEFYSVVHTQGRFIDELTPKEYEGFWNELWEACRCCPIEEFVFFRGKQRSIAEELLYGNPFDEVETLFGNSIMPFKMEAAAELLEMLKKSNLLQMSFGENATIQDVLSGIRQKSAHKKSEAENRPRAGAESLQSQESSLPRPRRLPKHIGVEYGPFEFGRR